MCSLAKSRLFCAVGGKDLGDIYQALYRKYRPRTFDEVCGQEHITETLKAQVASGRLSHAYLFVGTRGTGNTTCAKILAKAVNCLHPVNGDPCGECAACRGIDEGSVLDVVEIDAASNNGVENVRALREEAVFSPASVKKRVYIIDEVHMLSTAAFNALLKILEEPPEHLMFILATTELRKVPGTILSRCQRYSFRRLDAEVIAGRLGYIAKQEGFALTPEGAALLARLADGGMRDAISLLDQCSGAPVIDEDAITESLGLAGGRRTAELLSAAARHDAKSALDAFAALWRDGKDPAVLLSDLCALMRDVLVLSVAPKGGRELLSGAYDDATLKKFARSFTKAELLRAMERVQEAIVSLRDNPSPRTAVELCLVSLCDLTLCDGLPELRARVSRLEAGAANAPAAPASQPENAPAQDKGTEKAAAAKEPPQAAREGYIAPAEEEEERPPFPDEPPPERRYEDAGAPPWAQEEEPPEPPRRAEKAAERVEKPQETPCAAEAAPAPEDGCAPAEDISEEEGARVTASGPCWDDVVSHLKGRVPVGYWNLLTDPLQVRGEFTDAGLHVAIAKGFAANMLTKPDMMDKFRAAAAEIMGHGVPVNVTEMDSDEKIATRSIEELRRFKEVKFT